MKFELIKNALESKHLHGLSLPFKAYTDHEFYNLESKNIFNSDWFYACCNFDLEKAGDYFCLSVAGESIAVIKQADGSIKAVSNLCRHRGTPILDNGFSNQKKLVCPYHAWTFGLDGQLQGIPFPGKAKIDKKKHCLKTFKVEVWNNLVFVSLNPDAPSLKERYAHFDKYFKVFDSSRFVRSYQGKSELWNCNWKLAMENAMESYHLFKVHKNTLEKGTPTKKAFYLEGNAQGSATGGELVYEKGFLGKLFHDKKYEYLDNYILFSLPPSFVGILTYDSFDWIQIIPQGPEQSLILSGGMSSSGSEGGKYEKAFVTEFFEEDREICERVQKGMHSTHGQGGQLVEMEKVVIDFHQYIGNRVFGSAYEEVFVDEKTNLFFNQGK